MLSINTNLSSIITQNSLTQSTNKLNKAIERMSTGFKINHSSDNAANYSISTNMTTKLGAYQVAEDNTAMGLDMVNSASETLSEMENYATRLRALATQAQNGTYGKQSLNAIKTEAKALVKEINRLYSTTSYNGVSLLNRTEYDIPDYLPKAGKSGFIDESTLSDYALKRDEEDLFIDNPVTYTRAEVEAMTSIDEFDLTKSKKYKITSDKDLAKLAEIVNSGTNTNNAVFVLSCDIDLENWCNENGNWIPIGDYSTSTSNVFRGTFDGNGHTISNLKIDASDKSYQGLFGNSSGTIKNIAIISSEVNGKERTGLLVGNGSTTTNCHASGSVNGSGNYVGGLIGYGGVKYCNADVSVSGTGNYYGGLTGFGGATNSFATGDVNVTGGYIGGLNGYGIATNCYATGNVYATGTRCGALSGSTGTIKNSYSTGNIYCTSSAVGGLVGEAWGGGGLIENCFSTGEVYGRGNTGGLIGWNESSVKNCYSLSKVESSGSAGGLVGWFNIKNTQYIKNCSVMGKVTGESRVGGLIGDISIASDTLALNLENNNSYSEVIGNKLVGSFIGRVGITNDEVVYGNLNISNCRDREQGVEKIGGATKGSSNTNLNYNMATWLEGISNVTIKDTNINLQVGVNSNEASRITFAPKLEFDISEVGKNIESTESLKQIDNFLSMICAKQTELGVVQNRLESALEEISIQYNNLASSRSTIKDADIAEVSSEYIKMQILQQASATLLATANQAPSIALGLI